MGHPHTYSSIPSREACSWQEKAVSGSHEKRRYWQDWQKKRRFWQIGTPRKNQRQPQKKDTKVATAHTAPTTTEENAKPVPQRLVALEPSPRPAKQQRRQQEQGTEDGATASTVVTADAEGKGATGPVLQRCVALEGSPRPQKRRRTTG